MKKTLSLILTIALVVAIAMGVGVPAFAYATGEVAGNIYGTSVDDGYVTLDTLIADDSCGRTTVGDLFWTGTIGSAESSGTLNPIDNGVTWTLKDGVLVLKANHGSGSTSYYTDPFITYNSPFWNNEHIETIVIDSDITKVGALGKSALFRFGLPNLKTVIYLSGAAFSTGTENSIGDFPIDHEINYVWEKCRDMKGYTDAYCDPSMITDADPYGYPYAVGTTTYRTNMSANAYFTDRAAYLAAAAPVVANATLTQEAIDMLPADMIAAVNAIGGFKALGGNPLSAEEATRKQYETNGINVTVNGTPVAWTDAYPFVDKNDRTMVPLRAVADAMGLDVEWKADSRTAVFTRGDDTIMFVIGFKVAFNNRSDIDMDTEPVISNGRTYAPIRYLAEFFGYTVDWDGATQTVIITG